MRISALGNGSSKKIITLGAFNNIKTGILRHWKWLGSQALARAASQPQLTSSKRQKLGRKPNTAQCTKTARLRENHSVRPPSQSLQTPVNTNILQFSCTREKSWVGTVQAVPAISEGNLAAPRVCSPNPGTDHSLPLHI